MKRLSSAAFLALAGCGTAPVAEGPEYVPDPGGIAIVESPLRIDFGRAEAGVVSAMTRLEGRAPDFEGACSDGATRQVSWTAGPALVFQNGAFLGWATADGGSAGIACG